MFKKLGLCMQTLAAGAAMLAASTAFGQTYSNTTAISIPNIGTATPYPSTITVAGGPASIIQARVTLTGFTHTYPGDVAVLLVAPTGQKIQLLNGNGGGASISGVNLRFWNSAGVPSLPSTLLSGTYVPSGGGSAFSAPAPAAPYSSTLTSLAGANANGVWSLFVQDFSGGDSGSFSGGWSIEFGDFGAFPAVATPNAFTYQGRLTGGPTSGLIDTRFTVWDHPTSTTLANRVVAPVTVSGVTLTGGLFTATVDLGARLPGDRQCFLQIEVANPSGSAFVSLASRQPIAPAPLASTATGLSASTLCPDVTVIGGRQADNTFFDNNNGGSLTIQAPGMPGLSGFGAIPGELILKAGSHNNAGTSPAPGTSQHNDVSIYAGQNFWNTGWNGNIRFHGGFGQPERMRIVGDNGNVGIGTSNPAQKLTVAGNILATGTITPSCGKLKENVVPISDALDRLSDLNAVRFDWKADEARTRGFTHDLGFIAEDVAKVFPEVVFRDQQGQIIGLDYSRMSAVAVGAIKQLKSENDQLKARLDKLEAMMAAQAASSEKSEAK